MRHIGNITEPKQAERFVRFLATQHIEAELHPGQDSDYAVWVLEEERVAAARQHLDAFLISPDDERFVVARGQPARHMPSGRSRVIDVRRDIFNRWQLPTGTVTFFLIAISVAATLLMSVPAFIPWTYKLYFSEYFGTSFREIRGGQLWRLVTPIFLHAGILHLMFNMLWLHQLGGQIETRESGRQLAGMVLVLAVICNTGQYLVSGPLFVGMSGVVYGLLGYVWMMVRFQTGTLYLLSQQTVAMMLLWLGLCVVGIIPRVANTEHILGLLVGVVWGFLRSGGWHQMRRYRQFRRHRF